MTFPVTEEMVEAVCSHKFWITMISPPPVVHIDEAGKAWRKQIRECLEAALAVMPVPDDDVDDPNYTIPLLGEPAFVTRGVPVGGTPADAEFREAVESLIDASMGLGNVMAFPDDRVAGMRDVLSFLDTVREESRQWREKNPDRVRFEQAFRDGQWEAINLACTTIENRTAELEDANA